MGCAVPQGYTGGKSFSDTSLDVFLPSLVEPAKGKANVIIYRNTTSMSGLGLPALVRLQNGEKLYLDNNRFNYMQIPIGANELEVSYPDNMYGWKCYKTIFVPPNQVSFIKLGSRLVAGEKNPVLGFLVPLAAAAKESTDGDRERCAGGVEPFVVDKETLLSELK